MDLRWLERRARPGTAAAVGGLALLLAAGCGAGPGHDGSAELTDDTGRPIRLDSPPSRIVSLVPSVTELLIELGAADRIVARTVYDAAPELAHLPSVGGGLTPSVEWLAALRPDLVVAWPDERSRSVVRTLRGLGIPVYGARIQTLADGWATARRLGVLLDADSAAEALIAGIEAELAAVEQEVGGRPRPAVFYAVSLDPPTTAGDGTFLDELIRRAGGRNLFEDATGWPTVSAEAVVRRRPDLIVVADAADAESTLARLRARPGWRELPAVRDGRVHVVDPALFNRPGPRAGAAARRLAELFHPRAPDPEPGR